MKRRNFCQLAAAAAFSVSGCGSGGGEAGGSAPTGGGAPAGGTGGSDTGGNPIKLGAYADLTGSTATFGQSMKKGIDLALDEVNQKPPLGRKLEVLFEDDGGKPEQALSVVTKLITQDQVVAVIGEVASTRSMAAAPYCNKEKVPMITPASTNPKVTEQGEFIFRICFIDPFQGSVMAQFASTTLKAKTAAILYDIKNDYSLGLREFFKEKFTSLGGRVVAEATYAEGDAEFNAQLNTIKGANPEVLFVPGYYTEVGTIARQARDRGIKVPLLGGDGWDSPKLFEGAGEALEGCYLSNHYSAESNDERVQTFLTAFKAKNGGEVPDAMAALAYDAIKITAEAIARAGDTDGEKLRQAIAETKGFAGVTGSITLDDKRNATKPAVVLQVKGKEFKYVETVNP